MRQLALALAATALGLALRGVRANWPCQSGATAVAIENNGLNFCLSVSPILHRDGSLAWCEANTGGSLVVTETVAGIQRVWDHVEGIYGTGGLFPWTYYTLVQNEDGKTL